MPIEVPYPSFPNRRPTLDSNLLQHANRISGLICGEDIKGGAMVYINADGTVRNANGTAANAAARVRGFASTNAYVAQKDAVTILHGCELAWSNTLTPGIDLFLSATVPGGYTDTATTGGATPIGYVKDANTFFIFSPH